MNENDPKRKFFDILAGIILVGFVIFTAIIFLGTAAIPSLREKPPKSGPDQLLRDGYRIASTQYYDLKFSPDDSRVLCQRVENYVKDRFSTEREVKALEFPTGRIVRNAPPFRLQPVRDEVIHRLLTHYGFAQESIQFEMAVSHDGRELAFLQRFPNGTEAIILRTQNGAYRNLSSGPLPTQLTRLAALGRSRIPLVERLASPQELEWADAAIESTLQGGPSAALMADRVVSKVSRPGPDRDMLVRLLCRISRVGEPDEAGRAIVSAMEDPALQRQIEQGLLRGGDVADPSEGEDSGVEPVKVLEALLKRDWGKADDFLKTWLVQPLQEGYLEKMSPGMRPVYFRYLQMHLEISFARHLVTVVEGEKHLEAAAAAWGVRMAELRAEGKPFERDPRAEDSVTERAWFRDLRARRPDLFK